MCEHKNVHCVNPYEIIRKYICDDCGAVMMCSCDEYLGKKYFSHQLATGCVLNTQERIPVTLGFVEKICPECRGQTPVLAPKAQSYGVSTKIRRYYWREIYLRTLLRYDTLFLSENLRSIDRSQMKILEKEVIEEIKLEHLHAPKYIINEESQDDIIKKCNVKVEFVKVDYVSTKEKKARIKNDEKILTVEDFAVLHYEKLGFRALKTESRPFHVIFGVYMWLVIQDYNDAKLHRIGFGSREAYEKGEKGEIIWMMHPEDFGTSGYYIRRKECIDKHIDELEDAEWLFDYWLSYSKNLLEYLWAYKDDDVEKAREIVKVISLDQLKNILRYLVIDYWNNYLGWPDLFIYKNNQVMFVEVKGSGDKLRDSQKSWIIANKEYLKFDFLLLRFIKSTRV
jgi:hypothetical protein